MNKYMDIIDYNYTGPKNRRHMSIYERSAQFAPFAALTGYEDSIIEQGRIVDTKIILTDEEKEEINDEVNKSINEEITVTYYVPDKYKEGGSYVNYRGKVRTIDYVLKVLVFYDKKKINIEDIILINFVNN